MQPRKKFEAQVIQVKDQERTENGSESFRGKVQAKKSIGRMPWRQEPKKDVTNCDKLR